MEKEESLYSGDEKKFLLDLARRAISAALKGERLPDLKNIDNKLMQIRSCFVTLHSRSGALRGCIGNIEPFEPLAENVVHNAVNAAFRDPRFPQISSKELDSLRIEISILTVPEPVETYKDFIVGRHGIILNKRGSGAVFLPQVAPEQGWDAETTLTHLAMKAGLPPDAWKDADCRFKIFQAVFFSE
jgi:AmmeMemoRadiSam system protein A